MKMLLIYACLINLAGVVTVNAESQNDYAYQIIVNPKDELSLQKITLTNDIYLQSKNSDLNDLKVFDAKGQPMPFEISQNVLSFDEDIEKKINFYPIFEKSYLTNQTQDIFLSYDDHQQLKHIETSVDNEIQQYVVGYILDLGEKSVNKFSQFEFDLSKVSETSFLHFNIDQSQDLKNWTGLSSNDVLAQLYNQQNLSLHNKLYVSGINSRYLRLSINDQSAGFTITGVKQKYTISQKTDVTLWQPILFTKDSSDDFMIAEVPDTILIQHLKFDLNDKYTFLNGQLFYKTLIQSRKKYTKNKIKSDWKSYSAVSLYKIKAAEDELTRNQIDLYGVKTQALKLKLNYPEMDESDLMLGAQIGWKAQSLVFLAGGEAPYYIVTGRRFNSAQPKALNTDNKSYDSIISSIKSQLKTEIPEAVIISVNINQEQAESALSEISWSKIILWLVLILGVGLMLWMARNLLKQIGKED